MAITDQVSVMRQGRMVAHRVTAETNMPELAELMVGRKLRQSLERLERPLGECLLQVHNLTILDKQGIARVKDLSLQVAAGEIVGIAGVSGNGQSELLQALAGMIPINSGEMLFAGQTFNAKHPSNPARMRDLGLAHVPEDRQRMGLVLSFAADQSAILGYQASPKYNQGFILDDSAIRHEYIERAEQFDIRPRDPLLSSNNFSGGNQQKIVLAREIGAEPSLLLVGQPTRGVDIGAIELIHRQLMAMRNAGKGILLVSVELDEIMALSDRILVMCGGVMTGELSREQANEQILGLLMANALEPSAAQGYSA
jgi:simple sugar transport system ATP-binding protein